MILYKTHSEFEQTNLFPAFVPEGVLAFTEPLRNRMVIPIDEPPDQLQGLITHELTHVFEFDLIPRGIGFGIPARRCRCGWTRGSPTTSAGIWEPLDLMMIRDAARHRPGAEALAGGVRGLLRPRSSTTWATPASSSSRRATARRGSGSSSTRCARASSAAPRRASTSRPSASTPEEFDEAFDKWLKERFKPFRDKQRPERLRQGPLAEPGEDALHPGLRASRRAPRARSWRPSPRNRSDGEADVVLLSARDGTVIKNLTAGFDTACGELRHQQRVRGRPLDRLRPHAATPWRFFARTGKGRSLFLVSVLDGNDPEEGADRARRGPGPLPPRPTGGRVLFAALKEGVSDI